MGCKGGGRVTAVGVGIEPGAIKGGGPREGSLQARSRAPPMGAFLAGTNTHKQNRGEAPLLSSGFAVNSIKLMSLYCT